MKLDNKGYPTAASALQPRQGWFPLWNTLAPLSDRMAIGWCLSSINYEFLLTARPGRVLLCHFHGAEKQDGEGGDSIASTFSQHVPAMNM